MATARTKAFWAAQQFGEDAVRFASHVFPHASPPSRELLLRLAGTLATDSSFAILSHGARDDSPDVRATAFEAIDTLFRADARMASMTYASILTEVQYAVLHETIEWVVTYAIHILRHYKLDGPSHAGPGLRHGSAAIFEAIFQRGSRDARLAAGEVLTTATVAATPQFIALLLAREKDTPVRERLARAHALAIERQQIESSKNVSA